MSAVIDLTGQMFGRLTVIARSRKKGRRAEARWICRCDCGNKSATIVLGSNLRSGHTLSCGCHHRERIKEASLTHGQAGINRTAEYKAWADAKQRCTNPNDPRYSTYGARGITMCAEWLDSFETFYADMGPKPTTKHSIERKENNKGYSKSNCMWATKKQQANNKTTSHVIEFNGESHTIAEWTEILGLPDNIINHRLRRGWTEERALSTPVRALRKVAEHGTTAMYSNNGCRCPECREAMRMSYHIRKAKAL